MSLVSVALLAGVSSVTGSSILGQSNEESSLAVQSARGVMETMRGSHFSSLLVNYNEDGDDDPGGANTSPGSNFAAPFLDPQRGDVDGLAGEILMPLTGSGELLENQVRPEFGLPMDLNGDGIIDGSDHSSDYTVLPVIVRVDWRGRTGDRSLQVSTLLGES